MYQAERADELIRRRAPGASILEEKVGLEWPRTESPDAGEYQRVEPDFGKDASNMVYLGRPKELITPSKTRPGSRHERPLYLISETPGPGFYQEPDS